MRTEYLCLKMEKMAQYGTHDELVKYDGLYRQIYEKQLLEDKIQRIDGEN